LVVLVLLGVREFKIPLLVQLLHGGARVVDIWQSTLVDLSLVVVAVVEALGATTEPTL
jgi:hypothetical protein